MHSYGEDPYLSEDWLLKALFECAMAESVKRPVWILEDTWSKGGSGIIGKINVLKAEIYI